MDQEKLKKAIEIAKQNPNSEFANELRKRIETGQIIVEKEQPNYFQRVGEQYKQLGERVKSAVEQGATPTESVGGDIKQLGRTTLRGVGAVAEGAFAPIIEAPGIKQTLDFIGEKLGNTQIGQKLAQKIQENPEKAQDIMDIVNILTLGGGKAAEQPLKVGAEKVITKGKQALKTGIDTLKTKEVTKLSSQVDNLVGKITQGTGEDITMAKKALSDIDTKSIKTYKDLSDTLNSKIETLSSKLDEILEQSPIYENKLKLGDVEKTIKVGDKTVRHNYIEDALSQLEDFYSKTNNIAEKERILNLRNKFNTDGITIKEMNDLAKLHGRVLTGYNASGELASGLSKQAAENTRKGIKSTARDIFGDKAYEAIDKELSNIMNTKDIVDKVATKVETLKNRINQRGFGEKVGRLVFQVVDKFTGGGLKGFIQSFVPRGEGLKIMNALDLERSLNKNLKLLDKAINSKTESGTIKALEGILNYVENPKMGLSIEDVSKNQASDAFLKSQPTTNIINKTPQNVIYPNSTTKSLKGKGTRRKNKANKK